MLPLAQKIAFLVFAGITGAFGAWGFWRLYRRIARGRADADLRWDRLGARVWYALTTTLLQTRTFKKRPWVSFFHSFIFYGFTFYILVNFVDAVEGYFPVAISSGSWWGAAYNLAADVLSVLVLVGVVALVVRRFLLPSRRDFKFNERTLLHEDVRRRKITRDSVIVSAFILFHVGSRAVGAGAKLAAEGSDRFQPFASLLSHLFTSANAEAWRVFGYWGALGSVLLFLMYFPYTKHVHLFMAPLKYAVAREVSSGVLPALDVNLETEEPKLGAKRLEDLGWPRLLDAYACIQCNRCQDVCPASATGKSLSPAALEINKRMELNSLARAGAGFERGLESPRPLLQFALSAESAWACTTCGACMEVCPTQNEQMLDIIDIRRQQVMMEGEFPAQLQTAFRGMERASNPWGIGHEKRLEWAEGLVVPTIEENPEPDVLYWVGCAASYDPQSQKTARAFVQLLTRARVNFAVLGKKECCTGDTARRAGNEYLYRQLADGNVATLTAVRPKLIVATCPHCMNTIGKEYRQIGGNFKVVHHTEYLESLVAAGRLEVEATESSVTYHDPCYLGRHSGVYDAPRNVLKVLTNDFVELERTRENSFCCGAGGAQFWKEEEAGAERISDNRYREAQGRLEGHGLDGRNGENVLAVGCPFCKSMLESTPGKGDGGIAVKDVAELMLESVLRRAGESVAPSSAGSRDHATAVEEPVETRAEEVVDESTVEPLLSAGAPETGEIVTPVVARKKWTPKVAVPAPKVEEPVEVTAPVEEPIVQRAAEAVAAVETQDSSAPNLVRKKWAPAAAGTSPGPMEGMPRIAETAAVGPVLDVPGDSSGEGASKEAAGPAPVRKKWEPKKGAKLPDSE
ncbi:MAG TPA: heterodisulfide reductase-related iron-sulfur binding cluster [Acidobacteriaceae bacterium]|nr:heterodisulfide reductase-related iron-sulfur binding cluster [Acidobacteriaceae bacterium]